MRILSDLVHGLFYAEGHSMEKVTTDFDAMSLRSKYMGFESEEGTGKGVMGRIQREALTNMRSSSNEHELSDAKGKLSLKLGITHFEINERANLSYITEIVDSQQKKYCAKGLCFDANRRSNPGL